MTARIRISLSEEEQYLLQVDIHRGRAKARLFKRASILLKAAEDWTDAELCAAFQVCASDRSPSMETVRRRGSRGGIAG